MFLHILSYSSKTIPIPFILFSSCGYKETEPMLLKQRSIHLVLQRNKQKRRLRGNAQEGIRHCSVFVLENLHIWKCRNPRDTKYRYVRDRSNENMTTWHPKMYSVLRTQAENRVAFRVARIHVYLASVLLTPITWICVITTHGRFS